MPITSINPSTGKPISTYDEMTPEAVGAAIVRAHQAWLSWRETSFGARSSLMKRVAETLRRRKSEFAKLMADEMGKPLAQGNAEVDKCAWVCDYYADNAESHLADDVIKTESSRSYVAFEPLGVVLAIMPWNFPFWQVYRFAAPALMAGNAGLLKHASNVPGCALAIESAFEQAGFPADVFRTLLIQSSRSNGDRHPSCSGDADRQHARGEGRRRPGWRIEEDRPRARRLRRLRRARGRGHRSGGGDVRELAPDQRRSKLRRGKAVHRCAARARRVHAAIRRAHEIEDGRRPADRGNGCRATGQA